MAQQGTSGGWPYSGPGPGPDGSSSMTCAGLIGLATAVGRREERTLKADPPKPPVKKPDAPAKPTVPSGTDPSDPFYNPPKPPEKKPDEPAKPKVAEPAKPKPTKLDGAIKHGMDHLADALAGRVVGGKGPRSTPSTCTSSGRWSASASSTGRTRSAKPTGTTTPPT